MEYKVAFLLLCLIGLGFYVTTWLFVTGNPVSDTTGTAYYNMQISNVTGIVPTQFLQQILSGVKNQTSAISGSPADPPANPYSDDSNIYGHVGNISMTISGSGKNWDKGIARILAPYILAGMLAHFPNLSFTSSDMTIDQTSLGLVVMGILSGFIIILGTFQIIRKRRKKVA